MQFWPGKNSSEERPHAHLKKLAGKSLRVKSCLCLNLSYIALHFANQQFDECDAGCQPWSPSLATIFQLLLKHVNAAPSFQRLQSLFSSCRINQSFTIARASNVNLHAGLQKLAGVAVCGLRGLPLKQGVSAGKQALLTIMLRVQAGSHVH